MNNLKVLASGIIKNNPTFVLVLGMCPTLGTTTSAENGFGMGVATMAVLILSNLVISLIKNLIPDKVRIPAFIVVIASFVTIISMLMQAYVPALYASLGVFIPLIVVNCIILAVSYTHLTLHHPGTCGGIRLEERTGGFDLRRYRDWSGLHAVPDVGGGRPRSVGQRGHLRLFVRYYGLHAVGVRAGSGCFYRTGVSDGIV